MGMCFIVGYMSVLGWLYISNTYVMMDECVLWLV